MSALYSIIAKVASDMPPDCIRMAAKRLAAGVDLRDRTALWGCGAVDKPLLTEFTTIAAASGRTPQEIASALEAAAATAEYFRGENEVDILWTGPTTMAVPVRRMEQALCELIDSANSKLLIVSFVVYKADKVYAAIRSAIDRGVCVSFLTEAAKEDGGSLDVDPARILRKKFPEANFYRWENSDPAHPAVVHVKCAIADEGRALVTSANLTGAAMENNMELGLMISNRRLASRMVAHFAALIAEDILKKI